MRKLVSYRTDLLKTQSDVSNELKDRFPKGCWSRTKYQRIESGKHKVYLDDVADLCEYYEIDNPFDVEWYF